MPFWKRRKRTTPTPATNQGTPDHQGQVDEGGDNQESSVSGTSTANRRTQEELDDMWQKTKEEPDDMWQKTKESLRTISAVYRGPSGASTEISRKADEILWLMEIRDVRSANHPGKAAGAGTMDHLYDVASSSHMGTLLISFLF